MFFSVQSQSQKCFGILGIYRRPTYSVGIIRPYFMSHMTESAKASVPVESGQFHRCYHPHGDRLSPFPQSPYTEKGSAGSARYVICKVRGRGGKDDAQNTKKFNPTDWTRIVKPRLNRLGKDQGTRVRTYDLRMRKCNDSGRAERSRFFTRCMSAHAWGREARAPVYH